MDTGAEVSLMHRRVYDSLSFKPKLQNKRIHLASVSGEPLNIDGCVDLTFTIGGIQMRQSFYVMRGLNRNLILGQDWLKQMESEFIMILGVSECGGKTYVNIEEDIHIASVVRMKSTTVIKPQTAKICYGKVRRNPDLPSGENYQISESEKGFINREPGVNIINTVSKLGRDRAVPVLIVNSTNKTMKIVRHGVLGNSKLLVITTWPRSVRSSKVKRKMRDDLTQVKYKYLSNTGVVLKDWYEETLIGLRRKTLIWGIQIQ